MAHLYGNEWSFHPQRQQNTIKLLPQSAKKWICMGKWVFKILAELFLKNERASDDRTFFTQCVRYHNPEVKKFRQESFSRSEETIHKLESKFSIFAKNDYNSAVNTHFWACSKYNSFANFDPLMVNDGALELSHQGGFTLGLLAGGRHKYKNKLLVQGKQTVFWRTCYAHWRKSNQSLVSAAQYPRNINIFWQQISVGMCNQT